MNCTDLEAVQVCLTTAAGENVPAVAHYEYGATDNGRAVKTRTRYTDASGDVVYDPANFPIVTVGACPVAEVPAAGYVTTMERIERTVTTDETITVTAGDNLISWYVRNREGRENTMILNGNPAFILDADEGFGSGNIEESGGTITDNFSVTAKGDTGAIAVVTVRRV